jgi:hypothetical protein
MAFADAVAAPKVASLKEGQKAPFSGYLFDPAAYATIEADKQSVVQKCEIDKQFLIDKCKKDNKLAVDTCNNEKDIIQKNLTIQIESKDLQIKQLNEQIISMKPTSKGLWFGIGAGVGVLVSTSVYLLISKKL